MQHVRSKICLPMLAIVLCTFFSIVTVGSNFQSTPSIPAYVVTVINYDSRLPEITRLFKTYARINLKPFYGILGDHLSKKDRVLQLTPGQQGLRETMKLFFESMMKTKFSQVFIFQDDAIPHINFSTLFLQLHTRCHEADVLLLGASIWNRKVSFFKQAFCFNADHDTYGAYGLLVKRNAFQSIKDCLDKYSSIPFDHIYPCLTANHLIVRVAYPPFLVIMDVTHESLINNNRSSIQFDVYSRAKLHHWNLDNYPITKF